MHIPASVVKKSISLKGKGGDKAWSDSFILSSKHPMKRCFNHKTFQSVNMEATFLNITKPNKQCYKPL